MLRYVLIYLAVINVINFLLFAIDKRRAVKQQRRIREYTLLGFSVLGGALGGLIAMWLFRHKTRKRRFTIGLPVILFAQAAMMIYLFIL